MGIIKKGKTDGTVELLYLTYKCSSCDNIINESHKIKNPKCSICNCIMTVISGHCEQKECNCHSNVASTEEKD